MANTSGESGARVNGSVPLGEMTFGEMLDLAYKSGIPGRIVDELKATGSAEILTTETRFGRLTVRLVIE